MALCRLYLESVRLTRKRVISTSIIIGCIVAIGIYRVQMVRVRHDIDNKHAEKQLQIAAKADAERARLQARNEKQEKLYDELDRIQKLIKAEQDPVKKETLKQQRRVVVQQLKRWRLKQQRKHRHKRVPSCPPINLDDLGF